jgi:transposase
MAAKKAKIAKTAPSTERFYPELKPEQEILIMLIVHSGMSIKSAADQLNKTYFSVYRWTEDPVFQKCMETEKARLHAELQNKFSSLPEKAYNAIQMNLMSENPDVKVALQFLEKTGNLVKTTEKSNADEKTRRMAQALVAELSAIAED